jgi:hypothetical protein
LGEIGVEDAVFHNKTVLKINLNSNERYISSYVDQASIRASSVSLPGKIPSGCGKLSCPFSFGVVCNISRDNVNIVPVKYNLITAQQRLLDTINRNGINSFKNPKLLVSFHAEIGSTDVVVNINGDIHSNVNTSNDNSTGLVSFFRGYQEKSTNEDGGVARIGSGVELWRACVDLKVINYHRLEAIMKSYKDADEYHQHLLQRLIVLEAALESCNFSLITKYITKTDDDDDYHLKDINCIYDWALSGICQSNPTNELPCGSLKLYIENLLSNVIHDDIIDILLCKEVGNTRRITQKDLPVSYSIQFQYIINFLNGLKHTAIALLERKRSNMYLSSSEDEGIYESQFQVIEKDINEIKCMLQLCRIMVISCEEPSISLAFLKDKNSTDLRNQTSLLPLIDEQNNRHLPDEFRADNATLYMELVYQLKNSVEVDAAVNINEDKSNILNLLLLPLECMRNSNINESMENSLNGSRIIMLLLLDSVLSYYLTANDATGNYNPNSFGMNLSTIQIKRINNIAFAIGEAFEMTSSFRDEVLSLWKIDRSVDLISAVKSLCGSVILTSQFFYLSVKRLLVCNQLEAARLLLTHNSNNVLKSELGVIALAVSMTTKETWQKGWCSARHQSKFLPEFEAISSREKIAVLLCKWSFYNGEITKFLETPMEDEEQEAVIKYLEVCAVNEIDAIDIHNTINNLNLPSPFVDLLVIWLLRLKQPYRASKIHNTHSDLIGIENVSARGREQAINSFNSLPTLNLSSCRNVKGRI